MDLEQQNSQNNDKIVFPSEFIQKSLAVLPERAKEVLVKRFDLDGTDKKTLQEIGSMFKITRERIRQIEKGAIRKIKEMNAAEVAGMNSIFRDLIVQSGGAAEYDFFLDKAVNYFDGKINGKTFSSGSENFAGREAVSDSRSKVEKQNIILALRLCEEINHGLENKKFKNLFYIDENSLKTAEAVIDESRKVFAKEKHPMGLGEIFAKAAKSEALAEKNITEEVFHSYLRLSNEISENPFGQWGLKEWPSVFPKSIRDKSYLVVLHQKEPMHFKRIAELVDKTWANKKRSVLPETVHNELIKDDRFVLVGRGIYALAEWGYERGTVRDIIKGVLSKAKGPMNREEIVKEVSGQRLVKPGTIVLNLKDKEYFEKTEEGLYKLKA